MNKVLIIDIAKTDIICSAKCIEPADLNKELSNGWMIEKVTASSTSDGQSTFFVELSKEEITTSTYL